ncbi:MAG: carbon dioxide concentrating mechanism protein CcmL [Planctomycetaceae bacterium]|nr:carbon dioxide concentrating mechanism protein CcmL [Planctomycetaceae bacterium]
MRIGKIIGKVTLSQSHPSLKGASWRIVTPYTMDHLTNKTDRYEEELVIYDELGAGNGTVIAIAEGPEASNPFHPEQKPIDGYNAAILDDIKLA